MVRFALWTRAEIMRYAKLFTRSLSWSVLLSVAMGLGAAEAARLETPRSALTVSNGVVVRLVDRLCGETLVQVSAQEPGLCALHLLNQADLRVERAKFLVLSNSATRLESATEWSQPGSAVSCRLETRFESERSTGDILVQQEASRGAVERPPKHPTSNIQHPTPN